MIHSEVFLRHYQYSSWGLIFLCQIEIRTETMICIFISEFEIFINKLLQQCYNLENSFLSIRVNSQKQFQHLNSVLQKSHSENQHEPSHSSKYS